MAKPSFNTLLTGLFSVIIMAIISLGYVAYQNSRAVINTELQIESTDKIITEVEIIDALDDKTEVATRSYTLTGDSDLLGTIEDTEKEIADHIGRLRSLVKNSPEQIQKIDSLTLLMQRKSVFYNDVIASRKQEGMEATLQLLLSEEGENMISNTSQLISNIERTEAKLFQQQKQNSENRGLNQIFLFFLVILVLMLSLSFYAIRHNLLVRKKKEQEINRLNATLEQRVKERTGELKKANDELSKLFNTINEVLFSVDMNTGRMIQISVACEKVYGYSTDDFLSSPDLWNEVILPEDKGFIEDNDPIIQAGKTASNQYRIWHKDGTVRWVETKVTPTLNETGKLVRLDGVTRDITEKKKAEAELKALNESLEKKVIERTVQLVEANKDLEAFNFTVSHDLRTPLRAIGMFTSLARRQTKAIADEALSKSLDNIDECIAEMNKLIKHLLEFSQKGKELSGQKLVMTKLPMKNMITDVFNNLKSLENGKGIELVLKDTPEIYADKTLIKMVLDNLLSNAIKYSYKNKEIILEVEGIEKDDFVEYSIKDNGAGFNMKDADKLFKPFTRLHSATEFKGTGVGLAIVDKIIHYHNGKVRAVSGVGQGATFYFSIPVKN